MLLGPWGIVAYVLVHSNRQPAAPAAADASTALPYDDYVHQCRPGPWGELQYTRILIEPPDEFITTLNLEPHEIRWVFMGYSQERLLRLWQAAGLGDSTIRALEDPARTVTTSDAIVIKPTNDLVLGLSPDARARIYTALSPFVENPYQNEPFRFRADGIDAWFEDSTLPPATIAFVKRLIYRRGTSALFSDPDVVLPTLHSRAERVELMANLARKSTLLVKLRVTPKSDIQTLTAYWGRGPRAKDIGPLLASISHRPRGIALDITHLLPRFARARLFTYPQPSDHPGDINHDCHWTSLNFFNDPPDERFADADFVKRTFDQDYVPVVGPPTFGDIFILTHPDGEAIHSCVYIADDIVFTKNGASNAMPWMLMKLSDLIAFYPADPPLVIHAYRLKGL